MKTQDFRYASTQNLIVPVVGDVIEDYDGQLWLVVGRTLRPNNVLVVHTKERIEYPQGGIVGGGATQTRGEMVIQMNEREKEIFKKCRPGVTTEEWLNISRSLNEEIDEQMKHLKTPSMNNEELLDEIRKAMETVLLTNNGKDGNFRPIKGTTKEKCYNVLGKIQTLLETNKVKTQ